MINICCWSARAFITLARTHVSTLEFYIFLYPMNLNGWPRGIHVRSNILHSPLPLVRRSIGRALRRCSMARLISFAYAARTLLEAAAGCGSLVPDKQTNVREDMLSIFMRIKYFNGNGTKFYILPRQHRRNSLIISLLFN